MIFFFARVTEALGEIVSGHSSYVSKSPLVEKTSRHEPLELLWSFRKVMAQDRGLAALALAEYSVGTLTYIRARGPSARYCESDAPHQERRERTSCYLSRPMMSIEMSDTFLARKTVSEIFQLHSLNIHGGANSGYSTWFRIAWSICRRVNCR